MRTRGLEASLEVLPVRSASLTWTSRVNFAMSRCTMLELPVPPFLVYGINAGAIQIQQDSSCTQNFGNDTLGSQPGDAARGTIGSRIFRKIGDSQERFRMSFGNDITYKAFGLYFLWDWKQGGLVSDGTLRHFDVSKNDAGYTALLPNGQMVGEVRHDLFYTGRGTGQYVVDATFLKLRELRLGYTLPLSLVHSFWSGARSVRLEASGRNLLTFTPYQGYDPEVNHLPSGLPLLTELGSYPPGRSFWFSVDVGF